MAQSTTAAVSRITRDHILKGDIGTSMPKLIYGTAWKKDKTADLVYKALKAGFRGVDTAAQPKHYDERAVGLGVRQAISEGIVKRENLFVSKYILYGLIAYTQILILMHLQIQTKFTAPRGQNSTAPYDFTAPLADKVHQSVQSSLQNFTVQDGSEPYLDSLVLHSPMDAISDTLQVWRTLETYVPKQIRNLGVSNTDMETFAHLLTETTVKPAIVQNRFHKETSYENDLRQMCSSNGTAFQAFWTLSANRILSQSIPVVAVSQSARVQLPAAYFSLILALEGISILDGTTSEVHMREDLDGIEKVGIWAEGEGKEEWMQAFAAFKVAIEGAIM